MAAVIEATASPAGIHDAGADLARLRAELTAMVAVIVTKAMACGRHRCLRSLAAGSQRLYQRDQLGDFQK